MFFLTKQEIRDAEENAMKSIPSFVLIRNAGTKLFEHAREFESLRIYCGKGNNGSDGYQTAIFLKQAGKNVEIVEVLPPQSPECIKLHNDAMRLDIPIIREISFPINESECIIDCILGIGASGVVEGEIKKAIDIINASHSYVISADVPSGMEADTGDILGTCVRADKTVTFTSPKMGMIFEKSADLCGEIVVSDVGIPIEYCQNTKNGFVPITDRFVKSVLPKRSRFSHKGTFGTAVIVAGSGSMIGAAAMAGEAALRSGCGVVKIICPMSISKTLNIMVQEAIVIGVPEDGGVINPNLNEQAIKALSMASCILVGCGIGNGPHDKLIRNILSVTSAAVIIDADGINALSKKTEIIKNKNVIITPHPLEFSRISGISVDDIQKHRVQYADRFAQETGVSVLLKGARSLIAYGGSNKYISLISTSALSKAGSGDVLSGIIVALCAQGLSLTDSAAVALYIHGRAGLIAEKEIGCYGTVCGDIINNLPKVFHQIAN